MREFESGLIELNKGLRPRSRQVRNSLFLTECFNMRVSGTGLEPYEAITDPFSVSILQSWPFPQLLTSIRYKFLVVRDVVGAADNIYEVASDWSLTLILSVDQVTFGTGLRWSIADFDEYVLLTNGVVQVYRDTTLNAFVPILALANTPRCNHYCDFKGQLIGAGVRSSWHGLGTSDIIWSQIGNVDCTPTDNNEAGYRRFPYEGEVYQVRRLGDHVIAYGEHGVMAMTPVIEPAPSFRFTEILESGIVSRYAVGGDKNGHVFVSEKGFIYKLGRNLELKKLEYDEFTTQLSDIVISHDEKKNDFYICDGSNGYLLTDFGLSEIDETPASLFYEDRLVGTFTGIDDIEARLTSDIYDMGLAGHKTSHVVEVIGDASASIYTAIDWRMKRKDALQRTDLVEINDQNVATIRVSGVDMRIAVKCDNYIDFNLDYIKLRYNMSDLRNIRGVYAPPPRGQ